MSPPPSDPPVAGRRAILQAAVLGLLTLPVIAACSDGATSEVRHPVLAPPKDAVHVVGIDVTSPGPAARQSVLAFLTIVDDTPHPGVMIGFGPGLFERAGVPGARPTLLTPMPAFTGDVLEGRRTQGDLLLHVEGDDEADAREKAETILGKVEGLTVRWRLAGHRPENQVKAGRPLVRNPFGYTEGHGNSPAASATAARDVLIPRRAGEPEWTAGATLLSVRVMRLARELWDAEDPAKQDRIIGRHRDGRWLDGRPSTAEANFRGDPEGAVTPLDSHVRAVNPRTPDQPAPRLLRRSWAYSAGKTPEGQPDEGILFMAYQADPKTGFERAQRRLDTEAMTPYVLAVGGGYFAIPARRPATGWESVLRS